MPEPRDRLSRPVDIASVFVRQRSAGLGVLIDTEPDPPALAPPLQQWPDAAMGTPGRGGLGTPRASYVRARNSYRSPAVRRQNSSAGSARRARGRAMNSVLPPWYPRTPFRDITVISRAIERGRARLREVEGQEIASPAPQGQGLFDSFVTGSSAQLEHNSAMISPFPTVGIKPHALSAGKMSNIWIDIANQTSEDSECLTPQKKLLSSIDTVEKVVKEELRKLKRTPTAKKAEREKRVRTLMSMR